MASLFYLVSALPPLKRQEAPQLSFQEFSLMCKENLPAKEWQQLKTLMHLTDLENIRSLYVGTPWDDRGLYSKVELEAHLQDKTGFPEYVLSFLDSHDEVEDRIKHYPSLLAQYFVVESQQQDGFVAAYLHFARSLRLVITALRAKRIGVPVEPELRYEDPSDPIVAQILAQKDAQSYEPPLEFEPLKRLFSEEETSPLELAKGVLAFEWDYLSEAMETKVFSTEYVLAYGLKLGALERWFALDASKSKELVEDILKEEA